MTDQMANNEFEKLAEQFHRDTGMLPPGKDEAPGSIDRTNYTRVEVRAVLWPLWRRARRRLHNLEAENQGLAKRAAAKEAELEKELAGERFQLRAYEAENERLRGILNKLPDPEWVEPSDSERAE